MPGQLAFLHSLDSYNGCLGLLAVPFQRILRQFPESVPKEGHLLVPSLLTAGPARGVRPSPRLCSLQGNDIFSLRIPLPPSYLMLWKSTSVATADAVEAVKKENTEGVNMCQGTHCLRSTCCYSGPNQPARQAGASGHLETLLCL